VQTKVNLPFFLKQNIVTKVAITRIPIPKARPKHKDEYEGLFRQEENLRANLFK